jgi:D-glycero-D-manno-heptose 1,7-bisphosphate phosphatase
MQRSAVFLDRDGTLIVEVGYLSNPDQLELFEGTAESVKRLNDAGVLSILVTNQSGVARGYFGEDTVNLLNQKLSNVLKEKGAYLDAMYYCPHHKKGIIEEYKKDCDCRKPKPGLINQAVNDFKDINLDKSYVIGDKACDIELARNAGCKGILLKTGYGTQVLNEPGEDYVQSDYIAEDIKDAVDWLLQDLKAN